MKNFMKSKLCTMLIFLFIGFLANNDLFASKSHNLTKFQYVVNKEKPVLILYYTPSCGYCRKVLKYLDEINKTVPLKNVQNDPKARQELFEIGGKRQVPCLFIDGKPLYESSDIIKWLSKHKEYFN